MQQHDKFADVLLFQYAMKCLGPNHEILVVMVGTEFYGHTFWASYIYQTFVLSIFVLCLSIFVLSFIYIYCETKANMENHDDI